MKMTKFYVGLVAIAAASLMTSCLSSEEEGAPAPQNPSGTVSDTGDTYSAPVVAIASVTEAVSNGDEIQVGATSIAESTEENADLAVAAGFVLDADVVEASNIDELPAGTTFGIEVQKSVETETEVQGTDVVVEKTTTIELTCNPKEAEFEGEGLPVSIYVNDPDGTEYEVADLDTRALVKGQKFVVRAHTILITITSFAQTITLEKVETFVNGHSGGSGK